MSAEFYRVSEKVLSATTNGIYQGILVALLAGLALRWFARINAATRHAIWFGVLLFVTALIPAHILLSAHARPETSAPAAPPAPAKTTTPLTPSPALNPDDGMARHDLPSQESETARIEDAPALTAPEPERNEAASMPNFQSLSAAATASTTEQSALPSLRQASVRKLDHAIPLPHSVCLGLISAWIVLAGLRAALLVCRLFEVRRIKARSQPPSQSLQALFDRLREPLATRRPVRVKISEAPPTAMLLGFFHPVVLLPADLEKDAANDEVEHVLRHELAHAERHDDWSNLTQQVVQAALFFHPAVWWISARLSLEREIACDDHVLAAHSRPRAYALTLANLAARVNHCRHLPAPGVSHHHSQLQQRITMILNPKRNRSPRLAKTSLGVIATATAALAALAIMAGPRVVLAQPAPDEPAAPIPARPLAPPASAGQTPAALPPGWSSTESGPRMKPPQSGADSTPPPATPATPSALPLPPTVTWEPVEHAPRVAAKLFSMAQASPPVASAASAPPPSPAPAIPSVRVSVQNRTIEERLDRIEHILDELEARNGTSSHPRAAATLSSSEAWSVSPGRTMIISPDGSIFHSEEIAQSAPTRTAEDLRAIVTAERAADQAQRDLDEARRVRAQALREHIMTNLNGTDDMVADLVESENVRVARMAADQAQRDLENAQRPTANRKATEVPLAKLEALRAARESLQANLKNLDHEIQQIEQGQNRPVKPASPDGSEGSSNGQTPVPVAKTPSY